MAQFPGISEYFDILNKSQKIYTRCLEPVCRKWDLTRSELDVLLFLHNNPGYDRAADIVAHRGMTKSHVSLSVANLQSRGLILTREDERDRRAVRLSLSEEGRQIAEQGRVVQDRFFGAVFEGLSREDLHLWQTMVNRVCDNINHIEG